MSSLDKKGALKHYKTGIIHQVQEEIVHKLIYFLHRKSRHESVFKTAQKLVFGNAITSFESYN